MTKAAVDKQVMVSVSHYTEIINNGFISIRGKGLIYCPECHNELTVHGTCTRKIRSEDGTTKVYKLRVLECSCCQKTHRELPDLATPYKRYGSEAILKIADSNGDVDNSYSCETRTWLYFKAWISWFFSYAQNVLTSIQLRLGHIPKPPVNDRLSMYKFLVGIVINNNLWSQHRLC